MSIACHSRIQSSEDIRASHIGISAPEQNGQEDHVEGVRPQVSRKGKVRVEGRGAQLVLHVSKVGSLPAHNGDQHRADGVAP